MLKSTIGTLISLLLIAAGSRLIYYLWEKIFIKISHKTPFKLDTRILEETRRPAFYFLIIFGFYLVLQRYFSLPALSQSHLAKFILGIFYSLTVLVITYLSFSFFQALAKWYLEEVAHRTKTTLDEEFIPLLTRLLRIVLFFIAITIILSHFKVNITGFIATAGVASLAVAFAAQETLANFISGFTIMVDRPFRVGDRIQLPSGEIGDVYEIGLRTTKILSFDHNLIIVPNSEMTKSKILNYSYPTARFKIRMNLGVAYGSDMEKVKKIIYDILQKHKDVLDNPPPQVFFTNFGDSSLDLLIIYWIEDYRERLRIMDEINMSIDRRFAEEGITIPFPQRDIHIIPPPEEE